MRTDRRMDGQTDMTKLTVAGNNFAKRPKPLHVAHKVHLCMLHDFRNKQRIFP